MKKILISTGGTGGHVIPSLSLYDHLNKLFDVTIISDSRGSKFIDESCYKFNKIEIPKISLNILKLPMSILNLFYSLFKTYKYLKKNKIEILISTGGYMSFAFCVSAKILGIKIFLFEPNMVIGKSNKLILKYCEKIFCYSKKIINFPRKYNYKMYLVHPILKKKIYEIKEDKNNDIDKNLNLLILGGSQGALFFDNFIKDLVIKLPKTKKFKLYQQVSDREKIPELKNIYDNLKIENDLFSFESNIQNKMSKCNFAITRCGATTLAELVYFNIPFIGIPFPFAKDDHQYHNALYYSEKNCCWLYNQNNISLDNILNLFNQILQDSSVYKEKYQDIKKISYKSNWNNVNKKLVDLFNEY